MVASLCDMPDLVLDEIVSYLSQLDVGYCRQVNRYLRRFIDRFKQHYPLPPVTISLTSTGISLNVFKMEVKSDWTAAANVGIFAQTLSRRADNDGDDYTDIVDAFFESDGSEIPCFAVSSFERCFEDLFSAVFEESDVCTLNINEASSSVLRGIANAWKWPRQRVQTMTVTQPEDELEIEPLIEAVNFCRPADLSLMNVDIRVIAELLKSPVVHECESFTCDLDDGTDRTIATQPQEFLRLKCRKLDIQQQTKINSLTLNLILKEWCNHERDFDSNKGWEIYSDREFEIDQVFSGLPVLTFTAQSPRTSIPPAIYHRISRGNESLLVFVKKKALLINHPIDYILSLGAMFR